MDKKRLRLPCPHCGFEHGFKLETCWSDAEGKVFVGLYFSDCLDARQSCNQQLVHGRADSYDAMVKLMEPPRKKRKE